MEKKVFFIVVLLFFSVFFYFPASGQQNTATRWVVPDLNSLSLTVRTFKTDGNTARCLDSNGQQLDVNVTVISTYNNQLDPNASVDANVHKPASDVNHVNFSNRIDGNYSLRYTFDANGTYRFEVHAVEGSVTGDKNAFIHVGSVGMNVFFRNNGQSFNPGTTQVIRVGVVNNDGNVFEGIPGSSALISISYPDNTAFVSSQQMTDVGDGNYTYTFTVPSTSGTYSATAAFSCGVNSDTNTHGSFTVPSSGGGGNGGGSGSGSSGGGGGGGGSGIIGGGGASVTNAIGIVSDWGFDSALAVGKPAQLTVKVSNASRQSRDFLVSVLVTQANKVDFFSSEEVYGLEAGNSQEIVFAEKWVPSSSGTYIIEIKLLSIDKRTIYDKVLEEASIGGELRYDLSVECLQSIVKEGGNADALLTLLNLGTYYRDVALEWWAEDDAKNTFGEGSMPIALYSNESRNVLRSIHIPVGSRLGKYAFNARVKYEGAERTSKCTFLVTTEAERALPKESFSLAGFFTGIGFYFMIALITITGVAVVISRKGISGTADEVLGLKAGERKNIKREKRNNSAEMHDRFLGLE